MGKAHLNREEYDEAIVELESAAKADPKLPFVHFHLGTAYMRKQDLERAKAEFLKDIAIEPDVAYDYDQLGLVFYLQQQDEEAGRCFVRRCGLTLSFRVLIFSWHGFICGSGNTRRRSGRLMRRRS